MSVNSAAQSAGLILSNARGEIGYHEGANNSNKFAAEAGHANNQAWCSTFVTAMMKQAQAQGADIPDFVKRAEPGGAAVESYRNAYQQNGRLFRNGTPQPGDLVFFGPGGGEHIGIVERVENGRVYTIEGNTSDQVARRSYSLSDPYINSFGRTFGDKIPPDAQLGGPANLQASPGGGGGGGGSSGGGSAARAAGGGGGGGAPAAGGGGGGGGGAAPAAQGASGGGGGAAGAANYDGLMSQLMQALAGGSEDDVEKELEKLFPGMDKKQLKHLAKAMKKHPELAKELKAHPEMTQKLQAAAQKGGKEMNAALKQMEHGADGFQGGKDAKANPLDLQSGGGGNGMDALAQLLPQLTQEVQQLASTVMQMARLAQAM